MCKLSVLGNDNKIHCCSVDNKEITSCREVTVRQVNPDFGKLQSVGINILWCYECSYLLEKQELEWDKTNNERI